MNFLIINFLSSAVYKKDVLIIWGQVIRIRGITMQHESDFYVTYSLMSRG